MDREFYLGIARNHARLPIATDMVLHEQSDPEACRYNGECLGHVMLETARRFNMPLVFPLMDLRTEKEWLLKQLSIPDPEIDSFHFTDHHQRPMMAKMRTIGSAAPTPRMAATLGALRTVSNLSDKTPVGMSIGPFSLMTKLVRDPIVAAYQSIIDSASEEAAFVLDLLDIGTQAIIRWVELQSEAGAKAICVCEPAFNITYLSPRQIAKNPHIMDTLVLDFNRRIKDRMDQLGVDLIFHDCGELNPSIISSFNALDPVILSLGSPCDLPSIAHLVNQNTVLMGNIPSKKFYSDSVMSVEAVIEASRGLMRSMEATGHPFILGTECDVLSVPGHENTIMSKIAALMDA